jgi:hypothetical protein
MIDVDPDTLVELLVLVSVTLVIATLLWSLRR